MRKTSLIILLSVFVATLSSQSFAKRNGIIYTGCDLVETTASNGGTGYSMNCNTQLTFVPTASESDSLSCVSGSATDAQAGTVSCNSGSVLLSCSQPPTNKLELPLPKHQTVLFYDRISCVAPGADPHSSHYYTQCYAEYNSHGSSTYTCFN